ncbi:hypothetical protein [Sphingomonas sp. MA1305]|uniref:hypothetical protein n=1 Tax=Sphingomonas sp. MA1305 TaxID=2479204 RepID=UPI0018DF51EC|nr:hypothetical protein [Sphingomonas sp. MA1305]
MDADVRDGLTPAVGTVLRADEATTSGLTGHNYRVIELVAASALFTQQGAVKCNAPMI